MNKNIYRLKTNSDTLSEGKTRADMIKFCKDNKIIGFGWSTTNNSYKLGKIEDLEDYKKNYCDNIKKDNSKKDKGYRASINNLFWKLKKDDLVWMYYLDDFYLCRIKNDDKYYNNTGDFKLYDVCHYVECYDFIKIERNEIAGKILNCCIGNLGVTFQAIDTKDNKIDVFCMQLYNKKTNTETYDINEYKINTTDLIINKEVEFDIFNLITNKDCEDIVGLYLQKEKKCYIIPSTNKQGTKDIEFELKNEDGINIGVQVKQGQHQCLKASNYKKYLDNNWIIYLFATNENVDTENNKNCFKLDKKELKKFIYDNQNIMPDKIKLWLNYNN